MGAGEALSLGLLDFLDLSAFGLEAASVLVLASVFVVVSVLVLAFGDVAALSADGLVALSAEAAGLFVEAGTEALAAGFVVVVAGVAVGIGFTEALAEGVMLAAAVAAGVALAAGVAEAETLAVAIGVAATVALGRVEALVLVVVVAPVVPGAVVTPRLKLGVTP